MNISKDNLASEEGSGIKKKNLSVMIVKKETSLLTKAEWRKVVKMLQTELGY